MGEKLEQAKLYEQKNQIPKEEKPKFHVTPVVGWMNDPNGFSVYKDQIHLFYQYYPYGREWGPMHWGHVVTKDMVRWEVLPVALAPEEIYDQNGCFSGSAIQAGEEHVLLYTGVKENGYQNQCLAKGNGIQYTKYKNNPVIEGTSLPEGCSQKDFRDPKIWKDEDTYYLIVGNQNQEHKGQVLLFSSKDLTDWHFETILAENTSGNIGTMWECPDFFALDGKHFLVCSPQDMTATAYEFHNGSNSVYFSGDYDKEKHIFIKDEPRSLDYGLDYYAPQTTALPDGRRILIAWLKSWDNCVIPNEQTWQGMMTLPRELRYLDGRMIQAPVRELEQYRQNKVVYTDQTIKQLVELSGIEGRVIDMTVEISKGDFSEFEIQLACNDTFYTSFTYLPKKQLIQIDRTYSGVAKDILCQRTVKLAEEKESLKLRFILDWNSIELFIHDGLQVATTAICTPRDAKSIRFLCDGVTSIHVEKYDLIL